MCEEMGTMENNRLVLPCDPEYTACFELLINLKSPRIALDDGIRLHVDCTCLVHGPGIIRLGRGGIFILISISFKLAVQLILLMDNFERLQVRHTGGFQRQGVLE